MYDLTEERIKDHERRITLLETRDAVAEVHHVNVEKRLDAIEDTLKWLTRLIFGGLVMAALAYALQGGFTL